MQSIENIKAIKYDNILHTIKQSAEHTNKKNYYRIFEVHFTNKLFFIK